ncbi:MAG: BspA family leucine-rich repeat surface protein [Lachnospiraceae bacterium]|nr:BspA family leucine-rich repeat surface protein [Lachnospiraceae bacterium]
MKGLEKRIKNKFIVRIFFVLVFFILQIDKVFANPYTMCNGSEFNKRVRTFLNNGDEYAKTVPYILRFERGNANDIPSDPNLILDVSEDNDGTVFVYVKEKHFFSSHTVERYLHWFSDGTVSFNDDAAYMFSGFDCLRTADLSDFAYVNDLHDTRYMFANCKSLERIKFKKTNEKPLTLTEVQGMFFNCQSLKSIDFTYFTTDHVDNMDEMFYRCYNLKNIHVINDRWNIESVWTFNRMFSDCYLLTTNDGTRAVDVPEDGYWKYAVVGDDKKEGFLKDINYTYTDYGHPNETVPIDDNGYINVQPETTANYAEEPEDGSVSENGITPYVGDSSTGYGATKETGLSGDVYNGESEVRPSGESAGSGETSVAESVVTEIIESSEAIETIDSNKVEESVIAPEESTEVSEERAEEQQNDVLESSDGRRIIEIDGKEGTDEGGLEKTLKENTDFIILALVISIIVILLLIGMVIYLFKGSTGGKNSTKM